MCQSLRTGCCVLVNTSQKVHSVQESHNVQNNKAAGSLAFQNTSGMSQPCGAEEMPCSYSTPSLWQPCVQRTGSLLWQRGPGPPAVLSIMPSLSARLLRHQIGTCRPWDGLCYIHARGWERDTVLLSHTGIFLHTDTVPALEWSMPLIFNTGLCILTLILFLLFGSKQAVCGDAAEIVVKMCSWVKEILAKHSSFIWLFTGWKAGGRLKTENKQNGG